MARTTSMDLMKIKTTSLELFKPALATMLAIVIACAISVQSAQAFTVTLEQVGANVVATGSGAFNLMGLTLIGTNIGATAAIVPSVADIVVASQINGLNGYKGFSGPSSFGPGSTTTFASSDSGASVGIFGALHNLFLPANYVSGTALSDTATFDNTNFSKLGVTPGTFEWTWGTGPNQNFTLQVGPAGVPDIGSTLGLFFISLIALFGVGRFRAHRLA